MSDLITEDMKGKVVKTQKPKTKVVEELCGKCRHYVTVSTAEHTEALLLENGTVKFKGKKTTFFCQLLCLRLKEPVIECTAFVKRKTGWMKG